MPFVVGPNLIQKTEIVSVGFTFYSKSKQKQTHNFLLFKKKYINSPLKVAQWKNGFIKKPHHASNLIFFSCHSLFTFLITVLLSFSITGSQLSQCFAVRNWFVSLTSTKTKAKLSILGEGKFKVSVLWGLFIKPFFH